MEPDTLARTSLQPGRSHISDAMAHGGKGVASMEIGVQNFFFFDWELSPGLYTWQATALHSATLPVYGTSAHCDLDN